MIKTKDSIQSGVILKIRDPRCKPWMPAVTFMIIFCFLYQDLTSKAGPDYTTTLNLMFQRPAAPATNPIMAFFCGNAYAVDNGGDYIPPANYTDYYGDDFSYDSYAQPPAVDVAAPATPYGPDNFVDTTFYSYDPSAVTYIPPATHYVDTSSSPNTTTPVFDTTLTTYNDNTQFNLGANDYLANMTNTSYSSGYVDTSYNPNANTAIPTFTYDPASHTPDPSTQFNLVDPSIYNKLVNIGSGLDVSATASVYDSPSSCVSGPPAQFNLGANDYNFMDTSDNLPSYDVSITTSGFIYNPSTDNYDSDLINSGFNTYDEAPPVDIDYTDTGYIADWGTHVEYNDYNTGVLTTLTDDLRGTDTSSNWRDLAKSYLSTPDTPTGAWYKAHAARAKDYTDPQLAAAAHYLRAYKETMKGGLSEAAPYAILIPAWTAWKLTVNAAEHYGLTKGPSLSSPPSFTEINAGYQGIIDALGR